MAYRRTDGRHQREESTESNQSRMRTVEDARRGIEPSLRPENAPQAVVSVPVDQLRVMIQEAVREVFNQLWDGNRLASTHMNEDREVAGAVACTRQSCDIQPKNRRRILQEEIREGSKVLRDLPPNKKGKVEKETACKIQQLPAQMDKLKGQTPSSSIFRQWGLPFAPNIMLETLPHDFQLPDLPKYDVTEDPNEHIYAFEATMQLYNLSDALNCRVFTTTLSNRALNWFTQLPKGSISSYEQLSRKFLCRFACNRRFEQRAIHLYTIRQREGESLRSFIHRFNNEVLNVTDATMATIICALLRGLQPGSFLDRIAANPPADMDELLKEAEKFVNVEDVYSTKKRKNQ